MHPLVVAAEMQAIATGSELLALLLLLANRRHRYLALWTLGIGCYFLSAILQILLQLDGLPSPVANLPPFFGVSAAFILWLGARNFLGLAMPGRRTVAAVLTGIAGLTLLWPLLTSHPVLQAVPGALTLVGLILLLGWTLLRAPAAAESAGIRLTGSAYLAHGTLILLAPFASRSPDVAIWGMTLSAVLTLLSGWGLLLMTIERSEGDLRRLSRDLAAEVAAKNQALAQAERLAILGEAVAKVVHETRNKLSLIELATHQLASDQANPASRAKAGRRIRQAVADTAQMVDDLLQVTRLPQPEPAPLDLTELLDGILEATLPRTIAPIRRDGTPVRVVADRRHVEQVLLNLIHNAVEAMPDGGTLTVSCERLDGQVCLSLADTGPGIAADDLQRVFDTFFSTKPKGNGLGLAICRTLLQQNRGHIDLRPGETGGTVAVIRLPAVPETP